MLKKKLKYTILLKVIFVSVLKHNLFKNYVDL